MSLSITTSYCITHVGFKWVKEEPPRRQEVLSTLHCGILEYTVQPRQLPEILWCVCVCVCVCVRVLLVPKNCNNVLMQ